MKRRGGEGFQNPNSLVFGSQVMIVGYAKKLWSTVKWVLVYR